MNANANQLPQKHKPGVYKLTRVMIALTTIAALLLIIVPNFFQSSIRSPVSRVKNDMRMLQVALETYYIDNNAYPVGVPLKSCANGDKALLEELERMGGLELGTLYARGAHANDALENNFPPQGASVADMPRDPFSPDEMFPYVYASDGPGWILISPGPDKIYDIVPGRDFEYEMFRDIKQLNIDLLPFTFDPTNGVPSPGDVWRTKE